MSVRARMRNSHFDDVSSICLKSFLSSFPFLAALWLGLQQLSVLQAFYFPVCPKTFLRNVEKYEQRLHERFSKCK